MLGYTLNMLANLLFTQKKIIVNSFSQFSVDKTPYEYNFF
jgi:hypothetical protein